MDRQPARWAQVVKHHRDQGAWALCRGHAYNEVEVDASRRRRQEFSLVRVRALWLGRLTRAA